MDIRTLRSFFMWCTILNGCILLLWTAVWLLAPEWLYEVQRNWFPLSREAYAVAMYAFVGLFKIIFLTFNVVPLIALTVVGRRKVTADEPVAARVVRQ